MSSLTLKDYSHLYSGVRPLRSESEWRRVNQERRQLSKTNFKIANYTDLLCRGSQKVRARTLPPPPPPRYQELSLPRPRRTPGRRPPFPIPDSESRPPASKFYRRYIKSIYEREPLFQDYVHSLSHLSLHKSESVERVKRDFHGMLESDGSTDDELYPWRNAALRPAEPASQRLRREHTEKRAREYSPSTLPKIKVYHPSTWGQ